MHCIIHKEALCAKSANLVDVMYVVVKVVNSILSRSSNHRQFQTLVDEVDVRFALLLQSSLAESRSHACCPVYAACRRRSPPFFVRKIFPTLISSSTRYGSPV